MKRHERILRDAKLIEARLAGMPLDEMSSRFGVSKTHASQLLLGYGLPGKRGRLPLKGDSAPERTADMERRYRAGETLAEIGTVHGLTRERVRQILSKRCGFTAGDGGAALRVLSKTHDIRALRNERSARLFAKWGLTIDEYEEHVAQWGNSARRGSPMHRYKDQRRNARQVRDIGWEITFKDWWRLWQESGKWTERGRGRYVMARIGDSGPYSVENVEIITQSQNSRDSYLVHPAAERAVKARRTRLLKAQQQELIAA